MSSSPSIFSSILKVPTSKISNHDVGFPKIKSFVKKSRNSTHFNLREKPFSVGDSLPSSSSSSASSCCYSAVISNSLTLDHGSVDDEELKKAESKIGAKVKVTVPIKVYHVPKVPEIDLMGKIGVLKQYVAVYKGKRISANLPYKVEFEADEVSGRDGKPVKFSAHMRDDEFEFLD